MARERFDAFIHGSPDRPPLIPFGEVLAERVANMDRATLCRDSQGWCAAVTNTARLLEADGIVTGFDAAIGQNAVRENAEDPGRDETFGTLLDVVDRLGQTERSWAGIVGAVTGPVALARSIGVDDLGEIKAQATAMIEAICQKRPDLLILMEGAALLESGVGNPERKIFNAVRNVASYFDVPLALYLEGYRIDNLNDLDRLRVPVLILGPDADGGMPDPDTIERCAAMADAIAAPLDFARPDEAAEKAQTYAELLRGHAYAFTSLGPIASDADLAEVRRLCAFLQTLSEQV